MCEGQRRVQDRSQAFLVPGPRRNSGVCSGLSAHAELGPLTFGHRRRLGLWAGGSWAIRWQDACFWVTSGVAVAWLLSRSWEAGSEGRPVPLAPQQVPRSLSTRPRRVTSPRLFPGSVFSSMRSVLHACCVDWTPRVWGVGVTTMPAQGDPPCPCPQCFSTQPLPMASRWSPAGSRAKP